MWQRKLQETLAKLVDSERGILAADESIETVGQRFKLQGIDNTEERRREYRELLFSTPNVGRYLSGVIMFEETLEQHGANGTKLVDVVRKQGMVPGVKVDLGKGPLTGSPGDMISYGLDGLAERLEKYQQQGACFAKWRSVYNITEHNPTSLALSANAEVLARYAAECQAAGMVPIVEPEVLIDGNHSIHEAARVSEQVLHSVFHALHLHGVALEYVMLKPSMVTAGKAQGRSNPEEVAQATLTCLRRTVPAAVPSINFLSGGQSPEEATANINALNQSRPRPPWLLNLSFARALQEPALRIWGGERQNRERAQAVFLERARLNSLALRGEYTEQMESG